MPIFTVADLDKDGNLEIIVVVPPVREPVDDPAVLYLYEFDADSITPPTDDHIRPRDTAWHEIRREPCRGGGCRR